MQREPPKMSQEGEAVIIPLPTTLEQLDAGARAFLYQYHCAIQKRVRGQLTLPDGSLYYLREWRKVVAVDRKHNILGLSNDPRVEPILWASPTGPGELKLSEIQFF
jgi:hypothetical protein